MNHVETEPDAYKTLLGVTRYVRASDLPKALKHLIDIRASQINGCAYCLEMHFAEAKADGETEPRLATVSAWREAPFFTPEERVALDLTERVTLVSQGGVSEELAAELRTHYSDKQIVELLMAIIAINSWNRLMVATGPHPPVHGAK